MKGLTPFLLFILSSSIAFTLNDQNYRRQKVGSHDVGRDVKHEEAIIQRYREITALLSLDARRKLALASRSFQEHLVQSSNPSDLYVLARTEVSRQFIGLSAQQTDLLAFCLLAEVVWLTRDEAGNEDYEVMHLDQLMTKRSQVIQTASNIMSSASQSQNTIVRNIK